MNFFNARAKMLNSKQVQIVMTVAVLIMTVIMPVEAFHLLVEIVVEIYELLEFTLDEVIHHLFETSRHTTQVIVFYLMLGMFLYGLYHLAKLLMAVNLKVKTVISDWHAICRERSVNVWKPWLLDKRVRMLCGFTLGGACMALLVF